MRLLSLVAVSIAIAVLLLVSIPVICLYRRFRGTRVIACPENEQPAAVEVDALQAAFSSFDEKSLRLRDCSRWPERQNCGQECLRQIETAPEDCLLKTILTKWYADKACALCGKPVGEIQLMEHKPALMGPDRNTAEWFEFRPEKVYEVLATHQPVCWDCHIASTFRRQHPDLVVDRPWKTERK